MRKFLIATTAVVGLAAFTAGPAMAQSAFQRNVDRDNVVNNQNSGAVTPEVRSNAFQRNDINKNAEQYVEGISALNTVSQLNVGRGGTKDTTETKTVEVTKFKTEYVSQNETTSTLTKMGNSNLTATITFADGSVESYLLPNNGQTLEFDKEIVDVNGNNGQGEGSGPYKFENTTTESGTYVEVPYTTTKEVTYVVPGEPGTDHQLNVQRDNLVTNNEEVTVKGTQRNVRAKNAEQTVLAFGANHSGEQVNRSGDADVRKQDNRVVSNVAVNNEEVRAFGKQVNRAIVDNDTVDTIRNVEQTVSATGAGTVDNQTNRGGTFQTNVFAGNTVVNNEDVRARGRQINENVTRNATQNVFATGASQSTTQLNVGGVQQRNHVGNNTVINNDGVRAVGNQINVVGTQSMRNARQNVSALGASRNVSQTNR